MSKTTVLYTYGSRADSDYVAQGLRDALDEAMGIPGASKSVLLNTVEAAAAEGQRGTPKLTKVFRITIEALDQEDVG